MHKFLVYYAADPTPAPTPAPTLAVTSAATDTPAPTQPPETPTPTPSAGCATYPYLKNGFFSQRLALHIVYLFFRYIDRNQEQLAKCRSCCIDSMLCLS